VPLRLVGSEMCIRDRLKTMHTMVRKQHLNMLRFYSK
jgi:hypothetical protein